MFKLQLNILKEWEMYKGKLKNWFEGNNYFKIRTEIKLLQGMLIKFNKIFHGALFIFRHFDHLRRLMFIKSLNCEAWNFLAVKRPVYQ